ncbi:uncharacterized protein LOC122809125 [Protopterus annectens]|uniref:uncharacterized protein LOC122809125 n=1 Tax=Protopterus annectens TaxID=7888 RepID=UPI001CFC40F7|nr:uncharacterized protein LOC122809125 [Protopterus annectens]
MEDCGTCKPCLRAQDNPNRRRTWKCIKRRCVNQHKLKAKKMGEKKSGKSSEKQQASLETESLPIQQQEDEIVQKCATPVENVLTPAEKIGRPSGSLAMEDNPLVKEVHKKPRVKIEGEPKILKKKKSRKNTEENQQCITSELGPDGYLYYVDSNVLPYSSRRKSRMCGECEACVQKVDCGSCDFCQDKPKFGGINRKRQKCRWRQCLRYAMKRLLPEVWGNLKGDQLGSMVALSLNHRKNVFAYRKLVKIKQAARRVRQVGMLFARAWEEEAVIAKEGKHINHMKGVPGFYTTPVAQQLSVKQEVMEGRLSQQFIQPVDTHLEQPTEFFKPSTEEQHPPPQLRQQMIDTHFSQQCVPQEYSQIGNVPGYYGSSMEQQQQHFKQEMIEERFDQQHIPHEKHHLPYGLENGAVKSFDNHVEPIRQFYSTHTEQRQVKRESVEMMISAQQCLPSEAGYGLRPPVTCQPSVPTIWPEPPQNPLPKNSTRAQEHTAEISQNFQVMSDMPTRNQRVLELKEGMMNDTSGSQHTVLEEQDVVCLTPAVTEHVAICQPKEANETVVLDQDVICLPQETSEHLVLCGPEEADESTPVITEIFSLGSYHSMSNLDGVLQEFLMELNELPLPAHWEVLHPAGPDLRLVQRSKLSNMSDTVIHIQPGLVYYIMVKDVPVPLQHEVFSTHPTRFRTVDDVVELICDLEAYRPCAGYQQGSNEICMSYLGARSPLCDVLVYGERCERCRINPAALRH